MNEAQLVHTFVQLFRPLVPKGRLAMEIRGEGTRRKEVEFRNKMVDIAKTNKLHRSVDHALSSVVVQFGTGQHTLRGPHITLHMDTLTDDELCKRMVIITVLVVTLTLLLITHVRSSHTES